MKKLLFTAIAAAGVAFGLRAEATLPTGTSFEGTTVTDPVDLDGQGEIAAGSYWSIPTGDANQSLKVTAYGSDAKLTGNSRVGYYADQEANQNNYLAIKTTFGKPVTRNVYDAGAAETLVDGGIYFDSLVKMTVCDEAPAADTYTDAKILVWAQETATGDNTNLWVRAGVVTVGTESTTVVPQDFNCGTVENADQWHRLTIKVIRDITRADGVPGFVVFWDKTAQGSTDAKIGSSLNLNDSAATFDRDGCLFASLVQSGSARNEISGVAFDGQGSVDDLLFTKDVPFDGAEDKEFFSIALGENVTSFDYTVGGETKTATETTLVPYVAGMTITISDVECAAGYMAGSLSGDGVDGMNFVPMAKNQSGTVNAQAVGVTVGDEKFADLASAFAHLNTTATGTVEMKLKAALASGELASAITINNANLTSVKIDLAGKTISCAADAYVITTAVPLWITDSVGGGRIACTFVGETESEIGNGALYATAPVTIDAGIFDGDVLLGDEEGQGKTISGGWFKNVNEGTEATHFNNYDYVADGYQVTLEDNFYKVTPKTFNITYTYKTNDVEVAAADLTGLVNTNVTTFKVEDAVSITDITLVGFETASITPDGWAAGEKTDDVEVIVLFTKKSSGWNPDADPATPASDVPDLPVELQEVSLKQISTWATGAGMGTGTEPVAPAAVKVEAFLLNCANTDEAVAEAKANFKFTAFDPTEEPTIDGQYNGTVSILKCSDAACTTEWKVGDGQAFYKAVLAPTPVQPK